MAEFVPIEEPLQDTDQASTNPDAAIHLSLDVTDPSVVSALLAYPEGHARDDSPLLHYVLAWSRYNKRTPGSTPI